MQLNLLYNALHGGGRWRGVPERFPALRLSCGRVRARRAGVRIPSLRARGPCQITSNMDARAAPGNFGEFWRTLAVFYTYF